MNESASHRPSFSIVIPVFREGHHLKKVLSTIQGVVDSLNEPYELIVVDDGSPDDTWSVIEEVSRKLPMLRALRLSRNFGKESALSAGLELARGDVVIVMDGDLQHPPELIPEMVRKWRESGVDVVEAVKESRGPEPSINRLGAAIFYTLLSKLSGYDLRGASDYKLMNRRVIDAWLNMKERNLFFRGMTVWLGFEHAQIPFSVQKRAGGASSWSIFRLVRLALTAVSGFSSFMLQIITLFGGLFFLLALYIGVDALYSKVMGEAISGFTTIVLLQVIIGSLLMISLGIIGIYIGKIYDEVKARPRYIVAEEIGPANAAAENAT